MGDGHITPALERRQVTTLAIELLIDGMNHNDGRIGEGLAAEGLRLARAAVGALGGRMVASGSPHALRFEYRRLRDNDARRAIEAGMAVSESVKRARADLSERFGVALAVRIGVHTAVLAEESSEAADARDRPADAVAQIAAMATPGGIAICGLTARLAGMIANLRLIRTTRLPAEDRPLHLFEIAPRADDHARGAPPLRIACQLRASDPRPSDGRTRWRGLLAAAMVPGAGKEVMGHVEAALDEAHLLDDAREMQRAKFAIDLVRGRLLMRFEGEGSSEAESCFARAAALAPAVAEDRDLFALLHGRMSSILSRGPLGGAADLSRQMLDLSALMGDPLLEGEALRLSAVAHFLNGDMGAAETRFTEAVARLALVDAGATLEDTHPALLVRIGRAWLLWFLDRPQLALEEIRLVEQHARALADDVARAFALGVEASLAHLQQDPVAAAAAARTCAGVAEQRGLPSWQAWGELIAGWAEAMTGEESGIALMRKGWDDYLATGAITLDLYARTLLADGLSRRGRAAEALELLDFDRVGAQTAAPFFLVEAYLARSRLEAMLGQSANAATDLAAALSTARRQGSAMLERRAVLHMRQHRRTTAMQGVDLAFGRLVTGAARR